MKKVSIDKYLGCLNGGVIGDALGAHIEFMTISDIRNRFGIKGITCVVDI